VLQPTLSVPLRAADTLFDYTALRRCSAAYTVLNPIPALYPVSVTDAGQLPAHEGGRNRVFICRSGKDRTVLRVSHTGDRSYEDYLAETEFVRYLAQAGAPVVDVLPSLNGRLAEQVPIRGGTAYVSLFTYARGMLIAENGYRYRDGAPLDEYFYNTGKALGKIHKLSKVYCPAHRRQDYFDKYNPAYTGRLIPDSFAPLKEAINARLEKFRDLPQNADTYGLVHFDYYDGNYHVDMETGSITVFDFDNCIYCWYMYDLADLWLHGTGWCRREQDKAKRRAFMDRYFSVILDGYRSETELPEEMVAQLPLFIDMVLIENIVDEFECCAREGAVLEDEDIAEAAVCLIQNIPFAGFC